MISETAENASSNPARGVTQGSRAGWIACAINRWLVLGKSAGPPASASAGEAGAGPVRRGTSIRANPFLGSGMLRIYRSRTRLYQRILGTSTLP